jgi:hypothetical protein
VKLLVVETSFHLTNQLKRDLNSITMKVQAGTISPLNTSRMKSIRASTEFQLSMAMESQEKIVL